MDIIIIGGGASGFFTAINIAEKYPNKKILILEKSKEGLNKVRISGGGRCNVTHAEFNPSELVKNYPRGEQELRSVFHRFMTYDVVQWFEKRGVALKTESDGRIFPKSDSSHSIIDCFLKEAQRLKIQIAYEQNVKNIWREEETWFVETQKQIFQSQKIVFATGSNPKMWDLLHKLGHSIVPPVPSLFTFNTSDHFITDLAGVSATIKASLLDLQHNPLKIKKLRADKGGMIAPLLITHWGFSGPAILKLSAWGARILAENNYQFVLEINWIIQNNEDLNPQKVIEILQQTKQLHSKKMLQNHSPFDLPKRLWNKLLDKSLIRTSQSWAELNKQQLQNLTQTLTKSQFRIDGKSIFKEEFVTAGGVSLKEIDFKTMKSKILPQVYLAGEILDIDAITGGFNFQNAWSGGYIISENITH